MKRPSEAVLKERDEFIRRYAKRTNLSIADLLEYRFAVPAALDTPEGCSSNGCEGWHMLRKSVDPGRDWEAGFIESEELLWWAELDRPVSEKE